MPSRYRSSGRGCFCIGTTDFPCRHRFTQLQIEAISLPLARTPTLHFCPVILARLRLLHKKEGIFVGTCMSPPLWTDFTYRANITRACRKATTTPIRHHRRGGPLLKQTHLAIVPKPVSERAQPAKSRGQPISIDSCVHPTTQEFRHALNRTENSSLTGGSRPPTCPEKRSEESADSILSPTAASAALSRRRGKCSRSIARPGPSPSSSLNI